MGDERRAHVPLVTAKVHNILLIGPRGSGKTTVAGLLAQRLGWQSLDADAELERRDGRDIRTIFAEEGEAGFRDKEEALVMELCDLRQHVIATGGGAVVRAQNRARIKSAGRVYWLGADANTLWRRIDADASTQGRR